MRARYRVEGWRGSECVAYADRQQPSAVLRDAERFRLDRGADRVYVRWIGDRHGMAADHDGLTWRRVDDPALAALLRERGEVE